MAGPWERFQAASEGTGPWTKFKAPAKPEEWERAMLLPMETNKDTGERRLAWPQLAVDAGNLFMAPGNAVQGKYDTVQIDPATGQPEPFNREMMTDAAGLAGLVAPGAPAGSLMRLSTPGAAKLPGPARSIIARALKDDQVPLAEIGPRMAELGSETVFADLGPRLNKLAQAVATMPGPGQKAIIDELRVRAAGRDSRIMSGVDETLGPATTPTAFNAAVKTEQSALTPFYQKAFGEASRVDTAPIALNLDSVAVNARGEAQRVAKEVRSMLNVAGTDQLDPNPQTLFEVRKAIDGMFDTVQDGNARRVLGETRKQVDEMLKEAVPGIKELDNAFAQLAKRKEAFETGQTLLDSGRTALRPPEVASMVATATPDILSGLSSGARAEIDRIIGTTANDLSALKRALGGEGDWNRARLAAVFGAEKADRLLKVVTQEMRWKALEDDALSGSRTQVLKAAQEEVAGKEPKEGILRSVLNLKAGDAASAGADKTLGWISRANRERVNAALADALMGKDAGVLEQQLAARFPNLPDGWNATARASTVENDRIKQLIADQLRLSQ